MWRGGWTDGGRSDGTTQVAARHHRVPLVSVERRDARRSFDVPSLASDRVSSGSDESSLHNLSGTLLGVTQTSLDAFGSDSARIFAGDSAKTVRSDWDVNDFLNLGETCEASPNQNIDGACCHSHVNAGVSDDPLSSLLNMDAADLHPFIMNHGDVASISAALNAALDGNKTSESKSTDAMNTGHSHAEDSAMYHRLHFVPRPSPLGAGAPAVQHTSPLGAGAPAMQHFDFAAFGIAPNPKVQVPGDYFYGVPRRVVSQERQAQLDRYRAKRARRLLGLNKTQPVRYECRKTLANARVRVKGRFVKASPEEKRGSMQSLQSFQSCPDLSTLADGAQGLVSSKKFVDDTHHRSSTSTSSRSSTDSIESNDDDSSFGIMDARRAERQRGAPTSGQLPILSGLRRTSQIRHCHSEICLSDLADA